MSFFSVHRQQRSRNNASKSTCCLISVVSCTSLPVSATTLMISVAVVCLSLLQEMAATWATSPVATEEVNATAVAWQLQRSLWSDATQHCDTWPCIATVTRGTLHNCQNFGQVLLNQFQRMKRTVSFREIWRRILVFECLNLSMFFFLILPLNLLLLLLLLLFGTNSRGNVNVLKWIVHWWNGHLNLLHNGWSV